MANPIQFLRNGGVVGVVALLTLGGCAKDPAPQANTLSLGLTGSTTATPGSAQDFVANVGDRVFFNTDSSDLTAQARSILDAEAQWLNRYPSLRFTVEGHADERGTREYNIALGARRAANVKDYLASRGVSVSRIQTISYGKERPVATCDDESCWAQNRRAVTVLSGSGAGV